MPSTKPRRSSPLLTSLIWFVPGLLAVVIAALIGTHPATLIPLLLANTLTMAAVCHAIGFDPEPDFLRTVMRRGAAHLTLFTCYVAIVFLLIAWPMLHLSQAPTLGASLLLAAALVVALGVLWRLWPAFALVFVWDDAYPQDAAHEGSSLFTAAARSLAFGRHLSREEHFFSHFLPAALAALLMAFSTVALSGLYGVLPSELHIAALALYAVVILPLAALVIANRTLRVMLTERRPKRKAARAEPVVTPPPPAPLNEQERTAGTPEQAQALLAAARAGDVPRALVLLEAGADPNIAAAAGERDQRPVLMLATLLPDSRLLRALIARGADLNRASGGLTPLLAATRDSWHGRPDAVMTLLTNGASPLATDSEGNTPLHGAVLSQEAGVAAMLLDAGAAIDALNAAQETPLTVACRAANWPLVKFLLERGAKPSLGEPALIAAAGIADDDVAGIKLLLKQRAPVNGVDGKGRSALMVAAAEGHVEIARALRIAGADVNLVDRHGGTALMEAARAGSAGVVQLLADAQADVLKRDQHGRDALSLACQSPHASAETVRVLLALGADPRAVGGDGRSPLDHAAASGRWELVALLDPDTPLPASLELEAISEGADTPGHLLDALRFGHWAIVSSFAGRVRDWSQGELAQLYLSLTDASLGAARRWLLDHGLSSEARLPPQLVDDDADIEQETLPPLGLRLFDAVVRQLPASAGAVSDLLYAGASPAGTGLFAELLARAPQAEALALRVLEAGADPFGPDERGRTPLQLAAVNGQATLLQNLLARGCNPNTRDSSGRPPLFAALAHGELALPLVRALVAHGADTEAMDANGETPLGLALDHPELERWLDWNDWNRPRRPLRADDLIQAVIHGNDTAVRRMLELGFAADTRDAKGASALLHACGAGHRQVAQTLLDAGADAGSGADNGMTPLAAAVAARRETLVALLIERGVAVDQRLPGDATVLMIAAVQGYPEIAEQLLDAGADASLVDARGHGALHAAAQFGFEQNDSLRARRLFDALLKRDSELDRADSKGQTPLLLLLGAHQRPGSPCDATHIGALLPVLLDAGAKVDHADERGVTALHACAMHALLAPARTLLARGADRNAEDKFGRTAADVARALGMVDIAHELAARASVIPSVRQTLRQPAQPSE